MTKLAQSSIYELIRMNESYVTFFIHTIDNIDKHTTHHSDSIDIASLPSPMLPNANGGIKLYINKKKNRNKLTVPLTSALPSPIKSINNRGAKSQPPMNNKSPAILNGHTYSRSLNSDIDIPIDNNNKKRVRSNSDPNIKLKNGLNINVSQLRSDVSQQCQCDYPFESVECIINVLSQRSKLSVFTIRVLSELLIDFVQDRTMKNNGLNNKHYHNLLLVWNNVKYILNQYLPLQSDAMETYFIDAFEEEWRSVRQQPKIETLIANPIRILPPHVFHHNTTHSTNNSTNTNTTKPKQIQIEKEKENNSSQQQQQLIRKLERIRKSIHNLLHISRLKTELLGGIVELPFIPRTEFKYCYRLQISLSTIASGCLNCLVLMQSKKRRRVLFSIREPNWLLLFNRMKGRDSFVVL